MNTPMPTYPQQHEPWRLDYPAMWNHLFKGQVIDFSCKPETKIMQSRNIIAFVTTNSAIHKAMKQ